MRAWLGRLSLLLCGAFLAGGAGATDLGTRMPVKAYPPPPPVRVIYNWTGFYFGVNFGGSFGKQDTDLTTAGGATLLSDSVSPSGVVGGLQAGYNWQFNPWVLGLEADFQGSSQKDDGSFALAGGTTNYTSRLRWFGTVRGRLGWAFDRWMPYITGGWAYGGGQLDANSTVGGTFSAVTDHDYSGWTVGAGVEWAFLNQWSAKIEYLYIDFGDGPTLSVTPALNIVAGRMTDNIVRAGLNYRFH